MRRAIDAVFENGVIKPLEAVDLEEHQRLRVVLMPASGLVAESRGLISASAEVVREVAEGEDFLPF